MKQRQEQDSGQNQGQNQEQDQEKGSSVPQPRQDLKSLEEQIPLLELQTLEKIAQIIGITSLADYSDLGIEPSELPGIVIYLLRAYRVDWGDLVVELLRDGSIAIVESLTQKMITRLPPGSQKICDYRMGNVLARILKGEWKPAPERRVERILPSRRIETDARRRYDLLKPGMRISEAIQKGVRLKDLREWAKRGDIEIGDER